MRNKYLDEDSSSESDEDDIDVHQVARVGSIEEMQWVLSKDRLKICNLKDSVGRVALHYACELGRIDMSKLLIAKGSDVNSRDHNEVTPLHLASSNGHSQICNMLLENGANIKFRDIQCWSALHFACNNNHCETVELLIDNGVDLNAEDHKFGKTALHLSAEKGYSKLCDLLIVRGANIFARGDVMYGRTPLHLACLSGHIETVQVLCLRDSDVNALCGLRDQSPLHIVCEKGHKECAEILLDYGADINIQGKHTYGLSPIQTACNCCKIDTVQLLIDRGADLSLLAKYSFKGSALHIAARNGYYDVVLRLIKAGSNIDLRDSDGNTSLISACEGNHMEIASLLISLNASVDLRNKAGKCALDYLNDPLDKEEFRCAVEAALKEKKRLVDLAERIAKEEKERFEREERLRLLRLKEEEEHRKLMKERNEKFLSLLSFICDINGEVASLNDLFVEFSEQDINGMMSFDDGKITSPAIVRGSKHGFKELVARLIEWPNIDLNLPDSLGNTSLHYAAYYGYRDIVELLLAHKVKTGIVNVEGRSAANLAKTPFLQEIIRNPKLISNRFADMESNFDVQPANAQDFPLDRTLIPDSKSSNLNSINDFVRGEFGDPPILKQLCEDDMFFRKHFQCLRNKNENTVSNLSRSHLCELEHDSMNEIDLLERYAPTAPKMSSQCSHLPTSFDSSKEWIDLKVFLWYFGFPYINSLQTKMGRFSDLGICMNAIQQIFCDVDALDKEKINESSLYLSQSCSLFVNSILSIFEPDDGWPKKLNGTMTSAWERIGLLHYGQIITKDVQNLLFKLLEYGGQVSSKPSMLSDFQRDDIVQSIVLGPRHRRVLVDAIYDISLTILSKCEASYPVDCVRSRFWMKLAAVLKSEEIVNQNRKAFENDTGRFGFHIWLMDLKLEWYEKQFNDIGFQVIEDFYELSYSDCQDYFPFLKLGDLRRLSKAVSLLNDDVVQTYQRRAYSKDVVVPLPPLPSVNSNDCNTNSRPQSKNKPNREITSLSFPKI